MAAFVMRKNDDLFVLWSIPKKEFGELPDREEPYGRINATKLMKQTFFVIFIGK